MKRIATFLAITIFPLVVKAEADPMVVDAVLQVTKGVPREDVVENYDACDSGVTYPMKLCFAYRWMVEDLRMNREYQRVIVAAKAVGADPALRAAQRSWVAFRDKECAFQGSIEAGGGSAEGVVVLACKQTVTGLRAGQLAKLADLYSSGRGQ